MAVLFEHRLRVAGFETRALELDGSGPPLILLHGWSDSADTWRPLLDLLRRSGRRAVALDMPGYGSASPLEPGAEILPQLDRFLRAALIRFADGRPALVAGNSLGGCVALRAAADPGARIGGVVPIAPAGLDMAGWFGVIEGERLIRAVLGVAAAPARAGGPRRGRPGLPPRRLRPATGRRPPGDRLLHAPRLPPRRCGPDPCQRPAAAARAGGSVRARPDQLPGAGALGRQRPDGLLDRRRAPLAGGSPTPASS